MDPACQVRLDAFEGPLDLLLHLIDKNKLDIADIPISLVTNQYLEYLELMKALDVVVAGEYLVMAATLMHIKSRMLLPRPEDNEEASEDPRLEIVRPLQELARVRQLANALDGRPVLGRDVFVRGTGLIFEGRIGLNRARGGSDGLDAYTCEAGLADLLAALERVLGRQCLPRAIEITRARATLSERMESLSRELDTREHLSFFELFPVSDRSFVIVTFLAILELARQSIVRIVQEGEGSDIKIFKRSSSAAPQVLRGLA